MSSIVESPIDIVKSFGTMFNELDVVIVRGGHTNLKQTMKYAHFDPDYLKKAAHVMDSVFNFSSDIKGGTGTGYHRGKCMKMYSFLYYTIL